jgi:hypothetical protein
MKTIHTILFALLVLVMNGSNQLKLRITGNGYADETAIVFDSAGTAAYNPNLDAWKCLSSTHGLGQLYTVCGPSEKLAVYALPLSALDSTIDLYAFTNSAGIYLIDPIEMSPFANGESIVLEEIATGNMYNLRSGQSYTFTLPVLGQNSPAPFRIHFKNPNAVATGISPVSNSGELSIRFADNKVMVGNSAELTFPANILIFDMQGKELRASSGTGQNNYELSLEGLPVSAFIVEVESNEKTVTRKLIKTSVY